MSVDGRSRHRWRRHRRQYRPQLHRIHGTTSGSRPTAILFCRRVDEGSGRWQEAGGRRQAAGGSRALLEEKKGVATCDMTRRVLPPDPDLLLLTTLALHMHEPLKGAHKHTRTNRRCPRVLAVGDQYCLFHSTLLCLLSSRLGQKRVVRSTVNNVRYTLTFRLAS